MNTQQLRTAAIEKLRAAGVQIHENAKAPAITSAIAKLTGRKFGYAMSLVDFMQSYVTPVTHTRPAYIFQPLKVRIHPRMREIERAQPPMITPCGTGNYREFSKEFGSDR